MNIRLLGPITLSQRKIDHCGGVEPHLGDSPPRTIPVAASVCKLEEVRGGRYVAALVGEVSVRADEAEADFEASFRSSFAQVAPHAILTRLPLLFISSSSLSLSPYVEAAC